MKTITAAELTKHMRQILDQLARDGEEFVIEYDHQPVARLLPVPGHQTALEAMADLYQVLPAGEATSWLEDSRQGQGEHADDGVRDPWAS